MQLEEKKSEPSSIMSIMVPESLTQPQANKQHLDLPVTLVRKAVVGCVPRRCRFTEVAIPASARLTRPANPCSSAIP